MTDIGREKVVKGDAVNKLTLKETIVKYLSYYPLFIASFVICLGTAVIYIRYTVPKYSTTALILVKDVTSSTSSGKASGDLVENALKGGATNLENDMMLLRSSELMNKVVKKDNLNIRYYRIGSLVKADIYHFAPFNLLPIAIGDSNNITSFKVTNITTRGGELTTGPENQEKHKAFRWNTPFVVEDKKFVLVPGADLHNDNGKYQVLWEPVAIAAAEISNNFSVGMSGNDNTIIELNLLTENLERGKDILNSITKEFIEANIEEKKEVANNTINFINERLAVVSKQLGGVEDNLEDFKGKSKLINPEQQSSEMLSNSQDISKALSNVAIQQNVVAMIRQYLNDPAYAGKLVPSTLGLGDATLALLITKYNELQLKKEREAPLNASSSLVMNDLNNQIATDKASILESLQNLSKDFALQENGLQKQNQQYNEFLTSLPGKERSLQEMKRQQNITEGLYLYLLQKREETAVSASSSTSSYQQVDPATGYGPVEPNKSSIYKMAAVLGLLLPIGFIYLRDILNDKIVSRNDITEKVQIPITGEIGHIESSKKLKQSQKNNRLIEEQFQIVRTNLSALHKKRNQNVFLVTSSVSGEGKSLISLNLATVLAKSGHSVALLQFDLRKPDGKHKEANNNKGLSNYLTGECTDLAELYTINDAIPALHIFSSGPIHCNAADLLINDRLSLLFAAIRAQYDYVVVNSAPVELVSDALILGEYCDAVVYIIRQRFTQKKQLYVIDDIYKAGKLDNIYLILNDVKRKIRYGYYGAEPYYSRGISSIYKN